jgi:hypothetical protein
MADNEGMRERGGRAIGTNIASGRQLKAGRVLAGHTQASFAAICGYHVRSCIYWEAQAGLPTNNLHTLKNIEDALRSCGVVLFSDPAPGVRLLSENDKGLSPSIGDNGSRAAMLAVHR